MLLLLLADGGAFLHLDRQTGVLGLGVALAPLHELDGEGEAQDPGDEGVEEDLGLVGLQLLAGVLLPDLAVGHLLLRQAKQGPAVLLALGKGCDVFVDDALVELALLHPADDGQSLRGYVLGHNGSLPFCYDGIIAQNVKNCKGWKRVTGYFRPPMPRASGKGFKDQPTSYHVIARSEATWQSRKP